MRPAVQTAGPPSQEVPVNIRERRILDYLRRHGFATAESLAEMLDVAAITARRDLIKLEQQGLLKRVHGGAVPLGSELVSHIAARLRQNAPAKRAVALLAAGLVERGETLFLDAGSTCCHLAECLPEDFDLTVVTHSLDNINVMKQKDGIRIFCPGGELDERLNAFLGPLTENQLSQFFVDKAFLGAAGIDVVRGCVDNTTAERNIKAGMNARARKAYILADAAKFGVAAFHQSVPLGDIKTIVTNKGVADQPARLLRKAGVHILLA
jgi:DeoR/GlpR family transcriptional regulator of sugar metabolism